MLYRESGDCLCQLLRPNGGLVIVNEEVALLPVIYACNVPVKEKASGLMESIVTQVDPTICEGLV